MRLHGVLDYEDGNRPMDLTDAQVVNFSREMTGQVDQFERVTVELIMPNPQRPRPPHVFKGLDELMRPMMVRRPEHFNARSSPEFEMNISMSPIWFDYELTEDEMTQVRQGDILLTKVAETSAKPEDLESGLAMLRSRPTDRREPEDGRIILARGERTGHAHTVDADVAQLWEGAGEVMLVVAEETDLEHEEHESLTLEQGVYEVQLQEDWRPGANVTRTSMPDIDA